MLLVLIRFFHLPDTIDGPHAWRQYDTKQYIDAYYHGEAQFLEPAVCWMGGHKTLALELPIPEYLVAQLYTVFGPNILVARLFFLLCFGVSAIFLYKSLEMVFSNRVPLYATLVYGLMPLSLFYSRAIHIDFFVLMFVLVMLYYALKAISLSSFKHLLISLLAACIAFSVKAPYAFFFAIPIVIYAYQEKKFIWLLKRSVLFVLPVLLALWWTNYARKLNAEVPDWSFVPNFNNFTEMWYWYFGTWQQRSQLSNWGVIGSRVVWEVLGYSGVVLATIGLTLARKLQGHIWMLGLLLGTVLYVVIFFNVNLIHNYYQLPFIVVGSVAIALGVQKMEFWFGKGNKWSPMLVTVVLGLFAFESLYYAESNYYEMNEGFHAIAKQVESNSAEEDLVIVSYGGLSPQCPLILQPANRYGWSIPIHDLTPALVYQLWETGKATKLAIVYDGYFEGELKIFFEAMENKIGIPLNDEGQVLYLCDLNFQ